MKTPESKQPEFAGKYWEKRKKESYRFDRLLLTNNARFDI